MKEIIQSALKNTNPDYLRMLLESKLDRQPITGSYFVWLNEYDELYKRIFNADWELDELTELPESHSALHKIYITYNDSLEGVVDVVKLEIIPEEVRFYFTEFIRNGTVCYVPTFDQSGIGLLGNAVEENFTSIILDTVNNTVIDITPGDITRQPTLLNTKQLLNRGIEDTKKAFTKQELTDIGIINCKICWLN